MTITGATRTYAHIGFPIGHVRTPALYNGLLEQRGIDVVVVPVEVDPEHLAELVPALRAWRTLVGIGVTIPHKESMLSLVDRLTPMAELCGATNVIRRDADGSLVGGQFDGYGLVGSLEEAGHRVSSANVLLSGAGGTGRAVAFALAEAGAARITIVNRTRERAAGLAAEVRDAYPQCEVRAADGDVSGHIDIVVNTTSVGMRSEDPLPVDPRHLRPGSVVADAVMAPPRTALLALAEERGCVPHPGILMLQAQFESTLEFLGLTSDG